MVFIGQNLVVVLAGGARYQHSAEYLNEELFLFGGYEMNLTVLPYGPIYTQDVWSY